MTDAKQEALRQALHYHASHFGPISVMDEARATKRPTPDQIIATAKKFETFLDPKKK